MKASKINQKGIWFLFGKLWGNTWTFALEIFFVGVHEFSSEAGISFLVWTLDHRS